MGCRWRSSWQPCASNHYTPHALLQRLSDRLSLLTHGARDLPLHQQALRSAIAWSYDLLNTHEQALFARLGLFVGGCTIEAAETVCGSWELEVGRWESSPVAPTPIPQLPTPILE